MPRQVFVGTFGTRCFIGSALIREWRGYVLKVHALEEEVGNAAACRGHVSPKFGVAASRDGT